MQAIASFGVVTAAGLHKLTSGAGRPRFAIITTTRLSHESWRAFNAVLVHVKITERNVVLLHVKITERNVVLLHVKITGRIACPQLTTLHHRFFFPLSSVR